MGSDNFMNTPPLDTNTKDSDVVPLVGVYALLSVAYMVAKNSKSQKAKAIAPSLKKILDKM